MSHSRLRNLRVSLVLIVGLIGAQSGCQSTTSTPPPAEFVYGLTLIPSGIDPHINASSELGIPLRNVYDTLVYRDVETGDFVPGLASSWQISGDGLTYTFVLRQDVKFHDGTSFNAEAVRVNLERVLNPDNHSAKAAQLIGPIKSIQVHDEYTISLNLAAPFAPLMDGLSQPYLGMASPAALAQYDTSTYQFHQVGTGPYRFVEYVVNDRLVLERNPDYKWGPATVSNTGVPSVSKLIFRFFTDPVARSMALESHAAQVVGELLPTDAKRLSQDGKIKIQAVAVPGQPLQLMLNTRKQPTDKLAVRQALILATDRQAIVQSLFQGYLPISYGPLAASTLFYDPAVQGRYAYDPIQAVAQFNSTGWLDSDGDGWRDADGKPLNINIVVPPWGLLPDVAQLLQSQWENTLHVHVMIKQVASFPQLVQEAGAGDYNAIGLNFFGRDPVVLNGFFVTGANLNWSQTSDPDLDRWLTEGERSMDPNLRRLLYANAQSRIMDQALIVPIRDYVNLNGVQVGVVGLHFDAQGWFPYLTDLTMGQ